jgi:hypothetical protein
MGHNSSVNNLRFVALWGAAAILALVAAHVGFDAAASKVVASPPPDVEQVLEAPSSVEAPSAADAPRPQSPVAVPNTEVSTDTGNPNDPVVKYSPSTDGLADGGPADPVTVPNSQVQTGPGTIVPSQVPRLTPINPPVSIPPIDYTSPEVTSEPGQTAPSNPRATDAPPEQLTQPPAQQQTPVTPGAPDPSTPSTTRPPQTATSNPSSTSNTTSSHATTPSTQTTNPPRDVDVVVAEVPEKEGTNVALTSSATTGLLTVLLTQKDGSRIGIAKIDYSPTALTITDVDQNKYVVRYVWDVSAGTLRITAVDFIPAPAPPATSGGEIREDDQN